MRVLIVEDSEPFRRFVSMIIQNEGDLQIDSEVADGLLAVETAWELRPHLILLDIGLPKMDGLEVARRTVHLSPTSKILFVTQENSPQIVKEAFRIGAWAYVLKTDAATELLNAVRSVLRGDKFMSSGCFRSYESGLPRTNRQRVSTNQGF